MTHGSQWRRPETLAKKVAAGADRRIRQLVLGSATWSK